MADLAKYKWPDPHDPARYEGLEETARQMYEGTNMPGGGFVFAAGHNIQADVPPENVIALFDAVLEYGRYRSA